MSDLEVQKHIKQSTDCLSGWSEQAGHDSLLFIHCFHMGVGEEHGGLILKCLSGCMTLLQSHSCIEQSTTSTRLQVATHYCFS